MLRRNRLFVRWIALLVALTFTIGVASCGTIIYPERRGQAAGKVDVGIAVLDGLGLLLFIIPGVIAFAVDFSTGAIYLPPGSSKLALNPSNLKNAHVLKTDPKGLTRSKIEAIVGQNVKQKIDLAAPGTKVAKICSGQALSWGNIAKVLTFDQLVAFENNKTEAT